MRSYVPDYELIAPRNLPPALELLPGGWRPIAVATDMTRGSILVEEFPMLGEAARLTGGITTQNRGTIGGKIVNASPAADMPALLACDAEVELISAQGLQAIRRCGDRGPG